MPNCLATTLNVLSLIHQIIKKNSLQCLLNTRNPKKISSSISHSFLTTYCPSLMERLIMMVVALIAALAFFAVPTFASNYTVGGVAGWFFNDVYNSTNADYMSWAKSKDFFIGDYLIFNTDSNNKLVHTYNMITYTLCGSQEDDSNTTVVYEDTDNYGLGIHESLALELTVEGPNYFFSDDVDQCYQGMSFVINVGCSQDQAPPDTSAPSPSSPAEAMSPEWPPAYAMCPEWAPAMSPESLPDDVTIGDSTEVLAECVRRLSYCQSPKTYLEGVRRLKKGEPVLWRKGLPNALCLQIHLRSDEKQKNRSSDSIQTGP